ncbi:DNA polymerase IV [Desulfovibrio sp. OttesenSCG-928-G11]|nr:DNA polymerase IV [Desulfovibrio sp. OttesenSCG-928-G11]
MATHPLRWILHLDMDAFFASVEQLDAPELRGLPVIIGGAERGVVSTCSYEARSFGVRSAMPMFEARRLCPQAVFLRGRMSRYAEKSREVMELLRDFSPLVQQSSIDEAYLDATGLERIFGSAEDMARKVQQAVLEESGLTCSVGLAPVKFLAKIASDLKKPGGLTIIAHEEVAGFLTRLPIGKIPGVGPSMLRQLELLGVRMAADVTRFPASFWKERLGKAGEVLYRRGQGIDLREVEPYSEAKSESAENTFARDISDPEELATWLLRQSERVGTNLRRMGQKGRTVTLKLKYADFTQKSRSRTLEEATDVTRVIYETALALLREKALEQPLRLIGVGVSQFGAKSVQYSLLPDRRERDLERERALDKALDASRARFGARAVVRGRLFTNKNKD